MDERSDWSKIVMWLGGAIATAVGLKFLADTEWGKSMIAKVKGWFGAKPEEPKNPATAQPAAQPAPAPQTATTPTTAEPAKSNDPLAETTGDSPATKAFKKGLLEGNLTAATTTAFMTEITNSKDPQTVALKERLLFAQNIAFATNPNLNGATLPQPMQDMLKAAFISDAEGLAGQINTDDKYKTAFKTHPGKLQNDANKAFKNTLIAQVKTPAVAAEAPAQASATTDTGSTLIKINDKDSQATKNFKEALNSGESIDPATIKAYVNQRNLPAPEQEAQQRVKVAYEKMLNSNAEYITRNPKVSLDILTTSYKADKDGLIATLNKNEIRTLRGNLANYLQNGNLSSLSVNNQTFFTEVGQKLGLGHGTGAPAVAPAVAAAATTATTAASPSTNSSPASEAFKNDVNTMMRKIKSSEITTGLKALKDKYGKEPAFARLEFALLVVPSITEGLSKQRIYNGFFGTSKSLMLAALDDNANQAATLIKSDDILKQNYNFLTDSSQRRFAALQPEFKDIQKKDGGFSANVITAFNGQAVATPAPATSAPVAPPSAPVSVTTATTATAADPARSARDRLNSAYTNGNAAEMRIALNDPELFLASAGNDNSRNDLARSSFAMQLIDKAYGSPATLSDMQKDLYRSALGNKPKEFVKIVQANQPLQKAYNDLVTNHKDDVARHADKGFLTEVGKQLSPDVNFSPPATIAPVAAPSASSTEQELREALTGSTLPTIEQLIPLSARNATNTKIVESTLMLVASQHKNDEEQITDNERKLLTAAYEGNKVKFQAILASNPDLKNAFLASKGGDDTRFTGDDERAKFFRAIFDSITLRSPSPLAPVAPIPPVVAPPSTAAPTLH